MDNRKYLPSSFDTLSITPPNTWWNQQTFTSVVKKEIENEENSPASDYNMYPSETLKLLNHVNYYDNKLNMFEQVKEEFSGSECSQADCGMNTNIVSENNALVYSIYKQNVNNENTEEALLNCIKQENDNTMYQSIIKLETPDEIEMANSAKDMSIHYDVLVTLQEVKCKLCGRIFKNSFNLLKHNIEHIKINTLCYNLIELQGSQYCDDMLAHGSDVHEKGNFKCDNMYFKSKHFNNHNMELCHPNKVNEEINNKCDIFGIQYKSKQSLIYHTKITHFDYEIKIESDFGKELLKPIQLPSHEVQRDGRLSNSTYNGEVQCDHCQKSFKAKNNLWRHVRRIHYDYGKVFKCWCGKEFRSPFHLTEHKHVHKYTNRKVQCEICKIPLRSRFALWKHRRYIHNDYGKVYECWRRKEFPTPSQLAEHTNQQHNSKIEDKNNDEVQCDTCKKKFNTKKSLVLHIRRTHYDYGERVFKCQCGKVFCSPYRLYDHKRLCDEINGTLSKNFQCDVCKKSYKYKRYLGRHRRTVHKSKKPMSLTVAH